MLYEVVKREENKNRQSERASQLSLTCSLLAGSYHLSEASAEALLHRDADAMPRSDQRRHEARLRRARVGDGLVGDVLERGGRADTLGRILAPQRLLPGLEGALEGEVAVRGVHAERGEGLVHDPRVDMHAAVVLAALVAPAVVVRLRVLAEARVVVGRAGVEHVAERPALHRRTEETLADEPVVVLRLHVVREHVDQAAADVGTRLVAGAGLVLIFQARGELGAAVEDLVADDVADDEGHEDLAVTVAVGHLLAVPERVRELEAVVHGADEVEAGVVDALDAEDLDEEVADVAVVGVGVVHRSVGGGRILVAANELAGEAALVHRVEDLDRRVRADPGVTTTALVLAVAGSHQRAAVERVDVQRVRLGDGAGGEQGVLRVGPGSGIQQVARDDTVFHHNVFSFRLLGLTTTGEFLLSGGFDEILLSPN